MRIDVNYNLSICPSFWQTTSTILYRLIPTTLFTVQASGKRGTCSVKCLSHYECRHEKQSCGVRGVPFPLAGTRGIYTTPFWCVPEYVFSFLLYTWGCVVYVCPMCMCKFVCCMCLRVLDLYKYSSRTRYESILTCLIRVNLPIHALLIHVCTYPSVLFSGTYTPCSSP